ncbi:unannotated protein [freshwater metagenome]|uniref:Unannotated protein n=1 Tax=freshwater metagenome TaxID=449393 RepID=A0A6J6VBD2_9ZZZZ
MSAMTRTDVRVRARPTQILERSRASSRAVDASWPSKPPRSRASRSAATRSAATTKSATGCATSAANLRSASLVRSYSRRAARCSTAGASTTGASDAVATSAVCKPLDAPRVSLSCSVQVAMASTRAISSVERRDRLRRLGSQVPRPAAKAAATGQRVSSSTGVPRASPSDSRRAARSTRPLRPTRSSPGRSTVRPSTPASSTNTPRPATAPSTAASGAPRSTATMALTTSPGGYPSPSGRNPLPRAQRGWRRSSGTRAQRVRRNPGRTPRWR